MFEKITSKPQKQEEKQEQKPKEETKSEEETDLEEAIKSLELFKTLESPAEKKKSAVKKGIGILKGILQKKPAVKEEKPTEERIIIEIPENKKLAKLYRLFDDVENAISSNKMDKAKKLYIEARQAYIQLDYADKKEVYGRLTELYNKIVK